VGFDGSVKQSTNPEKAAGGVLNRDDAVPGADSGVRSTAAGLRGDDLRLLGNSTSRIPLVARREPGHRNVARREVIPRVVLLLSGAPFTGSCRMPPPPISRTFGDVRNQDKRQSLLAIEPPFVRSVVL
jgi:hypothetical protein